MNVALNHVKKYIMDRANNFWGSSKTQQLSNTSPPQKSSMARGLLNSKPHRRNPRPATYLGTSVTGRSH